MVLTPFSGGAFNNQLVKVLVENVEIQEKLISQMLETVRDRDMPVLILILNMFFRRTGPGTLNLQGKSGV